MTTTPKRNRRPEERNGPAEVRKDDQKGSRGKYTHSIRGARPLSRFERLCLGQIRPLRKNADRPFRRELLRQREIEWLTERRYGRCLPEQDGDEFFRSVAHALQAAGLDVLTNLRGWCGRWAPWALAPAYAETLVAAAEAVRHRTHDLRADAVANLLRVTMAERMELGLRTIGACDVTPSERRKIMKEKKMEQDRERQRANRRAEGRKDRARYEAESLSRLKPWETEGISRRTWERRRVASVSRVDSNQISDTPASTAAPTAVNAQPQAAQAAIRHDSDSVPQSTEPRRRRAAQRSEAVPQGGQCERMRAHPAEIKALCAALDFFHAHNAAGGQWIPAPGSADEMIAA